MVNAKTNKITTIAGDGTPSWNGDGLASQTQLKSPLDVACDSVGNVYIADSGNNLVRYIQMFDGVPGNLVTLAGVYGHAGFNSDLIQAKSAYLNRPAGLFLDSFDNIYIAGM